MMELKTQIRFGLVLLIFFISGSCDFLKPEPAVLVFSLTKGYHHESIRAGILAIEKLGRENKFSVDTTTDPQQFREKILAHYAAVIFLNTTGELLNVHQQAAFERYIQAGGGFLGIHAAADAEYDWRWYGRLLGGYFNGHPAQQSANVIRVDSTDPANTHVPAIWNRKDEWYNFKMLSDDLHILLAVDENSYQGGTNGQSHPVTWYHVYDGGRAWYTAMGHTVESFSDSTYLNHLLGGIRYVMGLSADFNYAKARSPVPPDDQTLAKTSLVKGGFFEPTEMAILPNMDVLVAERRGDLKLFQGVRNTLRLVGHLDVYWEAKKAKNVHVEDGLLGVQADPDFRTNHFIYIYYSPADTSVNRLSRFVMTPDSIDLKSEKIILQLYSQREICCHTGGSIAFGNDHNLFLSTGDNSTPFDEPNTNYPNHGFAPLDDRPGHVQYDSRRGAANSNDLRGKIIRIKINPDGTYQIPEGNLFPPGEPKTRPEIYVMGNRNPYRISVDKTNGYLYWGEVGPDANHDSLLSRGPKGYDEFNQARKAGFFGWPLFVGNNFPYHSHDYKTNINGPAFDPLNPLNDSRNNTGLKNLPPAQPALIWYPYEGSPDFPALGSGGRCAMAGPVYHAGLYPVDTRLPEYYNGKFFIYDFMRNWFELVSFSANGDFDKLEPFMEYTKFSAPIDTEMGPDGRLYILEYGKGWYTKNPDAGLSRIDFNPIQQ
ncbi:MAG TPA: ThuA domain-containing protein [Puia sp.]